MSRPPYPRALRILRGTDKRHPERARKRGDELEDTAEIGKPSNHLNAAQKRIFKELVDSSIEGVLGRADTIAVELAACLLYRVRGLNKEDGVVIPAKAAEQSLLSRYLSQFGMTPADRSKISIKPKKTKSVYDDF